MERPCAPAGRGLAVGRARPMHVRKRRGRAMVRPSHDGGTGSGTGACWVASCAPRGREEKPVSQASMTRALPSLCVPRTSCKDSPLAVRYSFLRRRRHAHGPPTATPTTPAKFLQLRSVCSWFGATPLSLPVCVRVLVLCLCRSARSSRRARARLHAMMMCLPPPPHVICCSTRTRANKNASNNNAAVHHTRCGTKYHCS